MRSSGTERAVAAALAITFDDRAMRRQLTLRHPEALERARLALELLDRREARSKQVT
jgi:TfoX/Sxy family transcriptional regulator of competence genes